MHIPFHILVISLYFSIIGLPLRPARAHRGHASGRRLQRRSGEANTY